MPVCNGKGGEGQSELPPPQLSRLSKSVLLTGRTEESEVQRSKTIFAASTVDKGADSSADGTEGSVVQPSTYPIQINAPASGSAGGSFVSSLAVSQEYPARFRGGIHAKNEVATEPVSSDSHSEVEPFPLSEIPLKSGKKQLRANLQHGKCYTTTEIAFETPSIDTGSVAVASPTSGALTTGIISLRLWGEGTDPAGLTKKPRKRSTFVGQPAQASGSVSAKNGGKSGDGGTNLPLLSCDKCDRSFATKGNTLRHIRTIHEGHRVQCSMWPNQPEKAP